MRKRRGAGLIFLILAAVFCFSPAAASEDQRIEKLLTQISALMDYREQIYRTQEEVYRAVRDFCEKNDYESLLNARMVCDEASRTLTEAACPELVLSGEELLQLMQLGVETDAIEAELQYIQLSDPELNEGMRYELLLYTEVYQNSQMEMLKEKVSVSIRLQELLIQYDCNLVNYLLNPVAENPSVREYWEQMAENWPVIGSCQQDWEENQEKISESTMELLDACEELSGRLAQLAGRNSYSLEQFSSGTAEDNLEALRADANPIAGMPAVLPYAEWMLPEETFLYASYEDESGSIPSMLTIAASGVELEAYLQYITELEGIGAAVYQMEGTDTDGWETVLDASGSVLLLCWDPDGTVLAAYDPRRLSLEDASGLLYKGYGDMADE